MKTLYFLAFLIIFLRSLSLVQAATNANAELNHHGYQPIGQLIVDNPSSLQEFHSMAIAHDNTRIATLRTTAETSSPVFYYIDLYAITPQFDLLLIKTIAVKQEPSTLKTPDSPSLQFSDDNSELILVSNRPNGYRFNRSPVFAYKYLSVWNAANGVYKNTLEIVSCGRPEYSKIVYHAQNLIVLDAITADFKARRQLEIHNQIAITPHIEYGKSYDIYNAQSSALVSKFMGSQVSANRNFFTTLELVNGELVLIVYRIVKIKDDPLGYQLKKIDQTHLVLSEAKTLNSISLESFSLNEDQTIKVKFNLDKRQDLANLFETITQTEVTLDFKQNILLQLNQKTAKNTVTYLHSFSAIEDKLNQQDIFRDIYFSPNRELAFSQTGTYDYKTGAKKNIEFSIYKKTSSTLTNEIATHAPKLAQTKKENLNQAYRRLQVDFGFNGNIQLTTAELVQKLNRDLLMAATVKTNFKSLSSSAQSWVIHTFGFGLDEFSNFKVFSQSRFSLTDLALLFTNNCQQFFEGNL